MAYGSIFFFLPIKYAGHHFVALGRHPVDGAETDAQGIIRLLDRFIVFAGKDVYYRQRPQRHTAWTGVIGLPAHGHQLHQRGPALAWAPP